MKNITSNKANFHDKKNRLLLHPNKISFQVENSLITHWNVAETTV